MLQEIQTKVRQDFQDWESLGDVSATYHNGMVLFNYRRPDEWNEFELMSRGLILNASTGCVIARPFDKFFNWHEQGRVGSGRIVNIMEKLDGSLGIIYRDPSDYKVKVATRGSFTSPQAEWATQFLQANYDTRRLPVNTYTLLVEIIYPDNRIVVDYGQTEGLVLLAAREMESGDYVTFFPDLYMLAHDLDFVLPRVYDFNSLTDLITATGAEQFQDTEGWVVELSDGSRWKFKTDQYREIHRLIQSMSPKRIVSMIRQGEDVAEWVWRLPQPYRGQAAQMVEELWEQRDAVYTAITTFFYQVPAEVLKVRKKYAQHVFQHCPEYSAALFDLYDQKPIEDLIWEKYVL